MPTIQSLVAMVFDEVATMSEEEAREWAKRREARYPYVWFWKSKLPERKGKPCRVEARGKMNSSILVVFPDGFEVITSRYAVRLRK